MTTTFTAKGMTCILGMLRVKKHLKSVPGVQNVAFNLKVSQVTVDYDPGKTSDSHFKQAVSDSGFTYE